MFCLRGANESDRAFVASNFLRSVHSDCIPFNKVPKDTFFSGYRRICEHLMQFGIVTVCYPQGEENLLLGFSIVSSDYKTLHYVLVKKRWQKLGVAKLLLPSTIQFVSHITDDFDPARVGCIFDPFKL